jgi:hypothetical protein
MLKCFSDLIGETIEAYVDDIVVKFKKADQLVANLEKTFNKLRENSIKLNPKKCIFGVLRGMLLGFIISERDIEANPEKITTITWMGPMQNVKGVQWIMGCLTALSHFISHLDERGLPLYRLLKKADRFVWIAEAQEALDKLKHTLMKAPILVPPIEREPLLLYIVATTQAVSAALVAEWEEVGHALKVQRPIYLISEVLANSKTRYPQIQKVLYAVLIAKRKLWHYFESHPVMVVSSFPLGEVIQNWDAKGTIAKWALELMGEGITYTPRIAIKSQALADFIAEWTVVQTPPAAIDHEYWTMYFDGSLMKKGAGVGLVLVSPSVCA